METTWYIKTTKCRNGVEERTKYPVRSDRTTGRAAQREAKRGARRADNSERQVARLLNNNFSVGKDRHIVLEYSDEALMKLVEKTERAMGADASRPGVYLDAEISDGYAAWEDAMFVSGQKDMENFIRRLRRACQKEGITLKYLSVTSDMDGQTGAEARLHHHLIVNAEAAELVHRKWTDGEAWDREMYNVNGDLSALASYMIRQVRPVDGTQRYKPSRTLEQPESSEPVPLVGFAAKYAENEMRLPKDCVLLYRSTYTRGAVQYIRYIRREKGGGKDGDKL